MSFILLQIDFNQQQTKNIRLQGKMQCRFRKMNKYIVLYVHEIKMTCIDMHI